MSMPRNEVGSEMEMAWGVFAQSLEKSIRLLDADIKEAKHMASKCTDEWCAATEHVISIGALSKQLPVSLIEAFIPRQDWQKKGAGLKIYRFSPDWRGCWVYRSFGIGSGNLRERLLVTCRMIFKIANN